MGTDSEIRTGEVPCRAQLLWRTGVIALFLASAFLSVCRSGSASNESAGLAAVDNTAAVDVAGIWVVQESIDARACGIGSYAQQYPVFIDQEGRLLVVTAPIDAHPYEAQFSGTITDGQIVWHGEFPEGGGTTTVVELTVTVQGDSFAGTAAWTWGDGGRSCAGATEVSGTRQDGDVVSDPFAGGGTSLPWDPGNAYSGGGGSQSWNSDYAYGGEDGNGFGYVYIPGTGGVTYGN